MMVRPDSRVETGCAGYVFGCGIFGCGTLGTCAAVDIREEHVESAAVAAGTGMRITHLADMPRILPFNRGHVHAGVTEAAR